MKEVLTAHPEAIMGSISDVQTLLETKGARCKILVMSSLCYASLLKEDHERNGKDPHVEQAEPENLFNYGYIGAMWGSIIYIDRKCQSYNISAYGDDCMEFLADYPEMWDDAKDLI